MPESKLREAANHVFTDVSIAGEAITRLIHFSEGLIKRIEQLEQEVEKWKEKYAKKIYHNE